MKYLHFFPVPANFWKYCTLQSPCQINEGDCDDDKDCVGSLICGIQNCEDQRYPENADCCTGK